MNAEPKLGGLGPPDRVATATQAPPPGDPLRRALAAVMASARRGGIVRDLVEGLRLVGAESPDSVGDH